MRKTGVTKQFHKNFEYRYDKIIAVANSWIFQDFINSTNSVLHFWCGGGYLLNALVCGDKYGVDSNPKYRDHAQSTFGFSVAPNFDGFRKSRCRDLQSYSCSATQPPANPQRCV